MVLGQDVHFITKSNIAKFELKTWTSGIIYCKVLLTFGSEVQKKELFFERNVLCICFSPISVLKTIFQAIVRINRMQFKNENADSMQTAKKVVKRKSGFSS